MNESLPTYPYLSPRLITKSTVRKINGLRIIGAIISASKILMTFHKMLPKRKSSLLTTILGFEAD